MISELPTDLQDLICGFAFDASFAETTHSLRLVLQMKENAPLVLFNPTVLNYTCAARNVYCRQTREINHTNIYNFFHVLANPCISPIHQFFVWFQLSQLIDYSLVFSVIHDLDWRVVRHQIPGKPSRQQFICAVQHGIDGLIYFTDTLRRLDSRAPRSVSAPLTQYLCKNTW